jgi:hypothetical protein
VFLRTKRVDDTQERLRAIGFRTIKTPSELHPEVTPLAILSPPWPDVGAKELMREHAELFRETLMRVFRQGYWCVVLDEGRYLTQDLALQSKCSYSFCKAVRSASVRRARYATPALDSA